MNNLSNVIGFTVKNRVRSKAFIVTSIIFVLLVTIGINLPYLIALFKSDEAIKIGMIKDEAGIAESLKSVYDASEEKEVDIQVYDDQGSIEANEAYLRKQIAGGEIKGYLLQEGEKDQAGFPIMTYKSEENMDFGTQGKLQNGMQLLKVQQVSKELGLSEEQVKKINSPVQIEKMQISVSDGADVGKTSDEIKIAAGLVYVLIILLFVAVMTSGQMIATEITAEKSSRVMEILITSVAPLTQMFGKIIGMFFVGLSQIALLFLAAIVNLSLPHNRGAFEEMNIDLSQIDPMLLVYALIFYLAGYLLYATLFAAVGSIVSRTEDLGQAVMPVSMISMVGYFIAIYGIQDPNSLLVVISSYVPFFSPFLMFLRMGVTEPALWEVWLSIGILFAAIFVFGWLSAKIYRTGVLMYGKRPTFKELRKAMKAYKI